MSDYELENYSILNKICNKKNRTIYSVLECSFLFRYRRRGSSIPTTTLTVLWNYQDKKIGIYRQNFLFLSTLAFLKYGKTLFKLNKREQEAQRLLLSWDFYAQII